ENAAETLQRGFRVIVQGRLVQRSFETREGEKRTVVEMQVDEIGPSLRYATAKVNRTSRGSGGGGDGGGHGHRAPPPPRPPGGCRRGGVGPAGGQRRRRLLRRAAVLIRPSEHA